MMEVHSLKINHITNPLGYLYKTLTASYITECDTGCRQDSARIIVAEDEAFERVVFDTGRQKEVSGLGTRLQFLLRPRTRYYWNVTVWDENGNSARSLPAWFETGLMEGGFSGNWIAPSFDSSIQPVFIRKFTLDRPCADARLYMTCLGVYEAYLNGVRVRDEVLAPGLTCYESYIQYQTYDISGMLQEGENILEVAAGDGWYKGLYGYRQNADYRKGKEFGLLADLYADGELVMCSDMEWQVRKSRVVFTDIYDGEIQDAVMDNSERYPVKAGKLDKKLVRERLGIPIKVKEILHPVSIIKTSRNECVLDMGQNMVGWVSFKCREERGRKVILEHGEVLQDGCFYNKNYRTAKARFEYISDGIPKQVHARLCFFGFRYVRLTGFTEPELSDFCGEVVYSDMEETGWMETGNKLVDRLISNILWSQKGNFLDIPTDCPQRDEKMGWTGDAQIFAGTASLNMECYEFFRKYLNDIAEEQKCTGGLVPQIVPSVGRNERTSAAWGDAAVLIPWTLYECYGDAGILEEQYESMKAWISYIDRQNEENGTEPHLWKNGFHYGDWLALDGGYYHMPTGGTDVFYVSSAYFYYSVDVLARTAKVLDRAEDHIKYRQKADSIREEIQKEYFTGNGRLSIDTQTACIIAIAFGLVKYGRQRDMVKEQLLERLRKDGYSLKTGFVGTPFILKALSECGCDDMAYRIFLNQDYPGWLYPVTLGATTMWERWDALNPDGSMSDSGMNSLNHYANGSVMEWMYGYMAGIRNREGSAGYKSVVINPRIHPDIRWMKTGLKSAAGRYEISWKIMDNDEFWLSCRIPFDADAEIILPPCEDGISVRHEAAVLRTDTGRAFRAAAGEWVFEGRLRKNYRPYYHLTDSVKELVKNPDIKKFLYEKAPMLVHTDGAGIQNMTLPEMSKLPFFLGIGTRLGLGEEVLKEIEDYISEIPK